MVDNILNKLKKLNFSTNAHFVKLFEQALNNSPLILISITEFLRSLQDSNSVTESYTMNIIMIYVIYNRFHNWFYIGISFTGSIWAEKHYTEKFSPDKKSLLLSQYHAGDINEKGKNIGEEIIILPIIIFPSLISLDTGTKSMLENLMRSIELRLLSARRQVGYQFYNNPISLSPNAPKSKKVPFKATIEKRLLSRKSFKFKMYSASLWNNLSKS